MSDPAPGSPGDPPITPKMLIDHFERDLRVQFSVDSNPDSPWQVTPDYFTDRERRLRFSGPDTDLIVTVEDAGGGQG